MMKATFSICILLVCFSGLQLTAQAIAINNDGAAPDSSAILDISSSNKGLLIPRMTREERLQIPSPAEGLLIFQTDSLTGYYSYFKNAWTSLGNNSLSLDEHLQIGRIDTANMLPEYTIGYDAFAIDTSGILYDSGGPQGNYHNNSNFIFNINHIPGALALRIVVISLITEAPYDSISIWATNTEIEGKYTYSGTYEMIPIPLLVSGSGITVNFRSNNVNTAEGFTLRWDWVFTAESEESAPLAGWYFNKEKIAMRGGVNSGGSWDSENTGQLSFAWGRSSFAQGHGSIAMGERSTAEGNGSVALGNYNNAPGNQSVAMGSGSDAIGDFSIALGYGTKASGAGSFAFGDLSEAVAFNSMAGGFLTKAQGYYSGSLGYRTVANGLASLVVGRYNDPIVAPQTSISNETPLFIVGNGSAVVPSNAFVVRQDGKVGVGTNNPTERLTIGLNTGDGIRIGSYETIRDAGGTSLETNAFFLPATDNSLDLGSSSKRWDDVWATNGVIQTSDGRDKEAITDLEYGLDIVAQLRPVSYQWKEGPDRSIQLGLIAQEVQSVLPGVVRSTNFVPDENGEITEIELNRLGMNYSSLIPVLIKSIQELQEENNRLSEVIAEQAMANKIQKSLYLEKVDALELRLSNLEEGKSHLTKTSKSSQDE